MNGNIQNHLAEALHHLYINPLEKCNLKCQICYTKKTSPILSEQQILNFIESYKKSFELKVITFCGGEVFTLSYFPHLINELTKQGLFIQIITNGTIDKLTEIVTPNLVNIIVSLDGIEVYHDKNRGIGNFQKSVLFLKKAQALGFHTEIFSIVTKQNFPQINKFESVIYHKFGPIPITYHPRKPLTYLQFHPLSNNIGKIQGFDFLSPDEIIALMNSKKVFPPYELGCYQISLMSDGNVYGCCEGFKILGKIDDAIVQLVNNLKQNINGPCLGCSQSDFMCGIKPIIDKIHK